MTTVLVASDSGCRAFTADGEREVELPSRRIGALISGHAGGCLAIVDELEVWRRSAANVWTQAAHGDVPLQSALLLEDTIFAGGMNEAVMLRASAQGRLERLPGFDQTAGRGEWFAGGPPLGVRSLAATAKGVLLAGVHVGGIPRSEDRGVTWTPTLPVSFDVHEVRAHPQSAEMAFAATAVGLCISRDAGATWTTYADGLPIAYSLAVAVLADEVLFSIQDGPFAKQSQIWRFRDDSSTLEQVRHGLPEFLDGKIDTAGIAVHGDRAAVLDAAGNLWLSQCGSTGWQRIAAGLGYSPGIVIVEDAAGNH